eukprot:scaffold26314_cov63-Phaeocystis_antarctica.AAC.5
MQTASKCSWAGVTAAENAALQQCHFAVIIRKYPPAVTPCRAALDAATAPQRDISPVRPQATAARIVRRAVCYCDLHQHSARVRPNGDTT